MICINQLRANIGGYGLSEDTVGGKGIKYAASVRMEVRSPQSGKIGPAEQPTGIRSKVKVVKNKLAAPYRTAEPWNHRRISLFFSKRHQSFDKFGQPFPIALILAGCRCIQKDDR